MNHLISEDRGIHPSSPYYNGNGLNEVETTEHTVKFKDFCKVLDRNLTFEGIVEVVETNDEIVNIQCDFVDLIKEELREEEWRDAVKFLIHNEKKLQKKCVANFKLVNNI